MRSTKGVAIAGLSREVKRLTDRIVRLVRSTIPGTREQLEDVDGTPAIVFYAPMRFAALLPLEDRARLLLDEPIELTDADDALKLRIVAASTSARRQTPPPERTSPLAKRLRAELERAADPAKAPDMQRYMKSSMPYLGVSSRPLRAVCKAAFAGLTFDDAGAWQREVLDLWRGARHREEWYAAVELTGVRAARAYQTLDALPLYERMIVEGAWWDIVDAVAANRIGTILQNHPEPMSEIMRAWSVDDDLWKRRSAIISQLRFKQATDLRLLYDCIAPSLSSTEFFLQKAIGWALRQLAWTQPDEVKRYVAAHRTELSPLSTREALKNVY